MTGGQDTGDSQKLAVLVTCYNRVATSKLSLERLYECLRQIPHFDTTIFVVDDASPDRTGEQLKRALPDIVLTYGAGNLFWNGGMCLAYDQAREHGSFGTYLLFNDDVLVDCDKVSSAFDDYLRLNRTAPSILVGSTRWHASDKISYSGFRRLSSIAPLCIEHVAPDGTLQSSDSFNGNFVLVPGDFFERVGGLDRKFRHGYGDIDLGYRARANGVSIYLAPEPIGWCDGHPLPTLRAKLPRWAHRWVVPWGKGDDLTQRAYFMRKHAPAAAVPFLVAGIALSRLTVKLAESVSRLAKRFR